MSKLRRLLQCIYIGGCYAVLWILDLFPDKAERDNLAKHIDEREKWD